MRLPPDAPHNIYAGNLGWRFFICPASGIDARDWAGLTPPVTHIVAVAGVGPDAANLLAGHPRAGVIGNDRGASLGLKLNEVPDGTSNTLLIAEIGGDAGPWARGGWGTLRELNPASRPHVGPGRAFGGFHVAERNWFSPHTYAMTAAMADGSVRMISARVAPEVLEALATAAGGESLPE